MQLPALSPPWYTLWNELNSAIGNDSSVKVKPLDTSKNPYEIKIVVDDQKKGEVLARLLNPTFPMGNITVDVLVVDRNGVEYSMKHVSDAQTLAQFYEIAFTDNSVSEQPGERGNRPRMPKAAGTEEPLSYRKQTDSYFKIINEEWVPEIIGDWDLPYRIYQAGDSKGWRLRDEVITRFMFETGARISEILELTVGDYRKRSDMHELAATNKGSFKRRIKFIRISPETLKLLIKYVNSERRQFASTQVKFNDLPDGEPLFLSTRGTPYTYSVLFELDHDHQERRTQTKPS
ncbi:tyrosine-type recombinase/integrase [Paenibacillus tarimensis]